MRKLLLIAAILFSQSANCTGSSEQDQVLVHFSQPLRGSIVRHDQNGNFHVIHNGIEVAVKNCFVDGLVRNCSTKYMIEFFKNGGYLIVKEFCDGELYIKAKMRLLGGGFFFCVVAAWTISCTGIVGAKVAGEALDNLIDNRQRDNEIFIGKLDLAVAELNKAPKVKKVKQDDILVPKCLTGPGIPIRPLPIRVPGTNAPYIKAPKEILRRPQPIFIGKITHV